MQGASKFSTKTNPKAKSLPTGSADNVEANCTKRARRKKLPVGILFDVLELEKSNPPFTRCRTLHQIKTEGPFTTLHHPEKSPNPPPPFLVLAFPFAAAEVARAAASIAGSAQSILLPLFAALAPAAPGALRPCAPAPTPAAVAVVEADTERGRVVAAAAPRYFPTPSST